MAMPAASDVQDEVACPKCQRQLLTVRTRVVGEPVTMFLCPACGYSRWRSKDEARSLRRVVDRSRAANGKIYPL